ncbi:uroporphyrinogen III synthase [Sulfuricaulis limicola]|uniref:Uroporphyrinogen-III synthase n=1 Tax=Sulfuricaulis limicola TaxID=1620215 RepID=A0A1B4XDW0_9GAMM|nr:uroporphyrinogen-III synthase [Sulfuricaulis limicola]BAV32963.1 uroporphyrinogen III synthase [Sulfuricaulis limicola]
MPESPVPPRTLAGVRVLVTRPRDQAENLAHLIEARGGEAIRFPVIEIAEPKDTQALLAVVGRLKDFALAIFVSPNAVKRAMNLIRARGGLPPTLRVACVGRGSARELKRLGIENVLAPTDRFDSEALLALPELQQVAGKRIVIFRGDGGRELLGDTLKARGAEIEYAECYRRLRPATDPTPLRHRWERGEVDIVSVTSVDGLRNLFDMLGTDGRPWLIRTPVVVVSERMAQVCRELGFTTEPRVAMAGDEAILEAIQAWRDGQNTL